jgi:hypothetical protein
VIGINNITTGCFHFDPSSPVPTKSITHYLLLSDTVSPAGSTYNLSVSNDLGLTQDFSDFFLEIIADPMTLIDSSTGVVDRVLSLSQDVGLTQLVVFAGNLVPGGGGGTDPIDAIFDSNTLQGMVVYVPSDAHADLAQADAEPTSGAVGLAENDVTSGETGTYLTEGQVERTDWTSIVGTTLLTPGAVYFLSKDTAGGMSTTAPIVVGESIVRIGRALSVTVLDIEISQPICL